MTKERKSPMGAAAMVGIAEFIDKLFPVIVATTLVSKNGEPLASWQLLGRLCSGNRGSDHFCWRFAISYDLIEFSKVFEFLDVISVSWNYEGEGTRRMI